MSRKIKTTIGDLLSADIQPSDYQHESLSPDLVKRLKKVKKILGDIELTKTADDFVDTFRRDKNPEAEICVWETIASNFKVRTASGELSFENKREILAECIAESLNDFPITLGERQK